MGSWRNVFYSNNVLYGGNPADELGTHQIAMLHLVEEGDANIYPIRYILVVLKHTLIRQRSEVKFRVN